MVRVLVAFSQGSWEGLVDCTDGIRRIFLLLLLPVARLFFGVLKLLSASLILLARISKAAWSFVLVLSTYLLTELITILRAVGTLVKFVLVRMFWIGVWVIGGIATLSAVSAIGYVLYLALPIVFHSVGKLWTAEDAHSNDLKTTKQVIAPKIEKKEAAKKEVMKKGPWVSELEGQGSPDQDINVEFLVLSSQCHWVVGKATSIKCGKREYAGRDFVRTQLAPFLLERISKGADLISLGAASGDGKLEINKPLAEVRAKNMVRWISEQLQIKGSVWVGNLGQFKSNCSDCKRIDADSQRPVVVATAIYRQGEELNATSIKNKMKASSVAPDPDKYSHFELQKLY